MIFGVLLDPLPPLTQTQTQTQTPTPTTIPMINTNTYDMIFHLDKGKSICIQFGICTFATN